MIKVLIAIDHAIVREGLKYILVNTPDIVAANEVTIGTEILDALSKKKYDVVLLVISSPGVSGLEILKQIKNTKPQMPVLTLCMNHEDGYGIRVLRAGAFGYLTQNSTPDELLSAIRKLSEGRKYISPSLAEKLAFNIEINADKLPYETLSDREYEVMCMIASGKIVKEIAQELSLSVKTISTYRSRILEKMDIRNNVELCRYAIQNGLIE